MLWHLRTRLKAEGALFLVYLSLYSALKFGVTFMRQEVLFLAGFQEAQVLSLAGGLTAVGLLIWLGRRQPLMAHGPSLGVAAPGRAASIPTKKRPRKAR